MAKILIVDDYPTNREFLTALLRHRHHQLLEAADGEEALSLARAHHPDLVITDLLMPRMDGYELLRWLRSDPALRGTRVLLYSAKYSQWETDLLDQAAGQVTRHLEKPAPPEDILRAVDEALSSASPSAATPPEEFDRAHLRLLTDKLARKVHTLDALNRLGQKIAFEADPHRLLQTLCGQAREILRAERAIVAITEDSQTIRHFYLAEPHEVLRCFATPPLEQALLRHLVADQRPRRLNALPPEAASAFPPGVAPVRNLLWVPIASPTRAYGALYVLNQQEKADFTEDDELVATTLGLHLGVAYENSRRAQALLQSQSRLNGIINSAMDAIISIDREQRIVLFNPAAEKLFGLPAAQALGEDIGRLIPQRFRAGHAGHVAAFGRTGTTSRRMGALGIISGLRANGEEFPIEAAISQIELEGEKLFTVILRDITARVKAEQALRASEEAAHRHVAELENIYRRTPVGLCFLDTELRYVAVNDLLAEFNGVPAREHIGRTVREVLPAQADQLEPLFRRVMETNNPLTNVEVSSGSTRSQSGATRHWLVSYYPVKNESIRGLNVVVADITERKRSEQALRQARDDLARANAELERRVEERTAQLVEANTNLQTFANSAAHDLRAPLRTIKSFSSLAVQEGKTQLAAELLSYLERVHSAAGQMERLLTDLLEYSKLSQAELTLETVDLRKTIDDALALLEPEIRARGAQVSVSPSMPPVVAHPATLLLIIANFVSNALKFVPTNTQPGIRLWAEKKDAETRRHGDAENLSDSPRLRVSAFPSLPFSASTVRLWVEDNGIGIDPKDQSKLFNAFQRLHGKQAYPGTGLGLAIIRKGAERMGGRVGVESEVGKGSRFWVELRAFEA